MAGDCVSATGGGFLTRTYLMKYSRSISNANESRSSRNDAEQYRCEGGLAPIGSSKGIPNGLYPRVPRQEEQGSTGGVQRRIAEDVLAYERRSEFKRITHAAVNAENKKQAFRKPGNTSIPASTTAMTNGDCLVE